jgi:hypothetical protein
MQTKPQLALATKILVALVVFGLVFVAAFRLTPEGKRQTRVAAARKHAAMVSQLLARDTRFSAVKVSEWWKGDGLFLVRGWVDSETDLLVLKEIVESSQPPAPIAWQVRVMTDVNKVTR